MLVPLGWLKDFVKLPTSTEKLAEKLLLAGTKVEDIKKSRGETIFELEITPNRPDTLSAYGVAREVAAIFDQDLKDIDTTVVRELPEKGAKPTIKVEDKKLMPFYSLVRLEGVRVKESPAWMKTMLLAAGMRPINNVVDITNFLMIELGQPMHAFDASKIKGPMTLRAAKKGEKVRTLDSVEREVNEGAIIIEDSEKLIDLAGLMGGENSEVSAKTDTVLLHVPIYDPVTIRKTSLFTGLRTEASNRFEKKIDPNLHPVALQRAIKLLVENANVSSVSPITTIGYPVEERSLEFDLNLVEKILGLNLETKEIINLLTPLGFLVKTSPLEENSLSISIPSHRQDVSLPEDILEEIGRIYGYNDFPKTLPQGALPEQKEFFAPNNFDFLRSYALHAGFSELTGYTLVPKKDLDSFGIDPKDAVKVMHPTSVDFEYLRPSLLINLLKALSTNSNKNEKLAFFEIGKEFGSKIDPNSKLPSQKTALGLITTSSYRDLKGIVETLLARFCLEVEESSFENPLSVGADFYEGKKLLAKVAILKKDLLQKYEVKDNAFSAWLDFDYLQTLQQKSNYEPENKFPPVIEDLSFYLGNETSISKILSSLQTIDKLAKKIEFLDSFVKEGKESMTVRIYFQNPEKTLTDKEVVATREKIKKHLVKNFGVEIRED